MNTFPQVKRPKKALSERQIRPNSWDNVRAQNGPGIAVVEHRPGPDLSASLDNTEEH